ncbi:MAG: peptide ABC transporter substrate-binding protein [Phycisphaeraceae bacterium]|nr:peptide ABC transporter substrate-binding protein [Phycisphaeraceae bacterium]
MKKLLYVLGGLVILAVVAVTVLPALLDDDQGQIRMITSPLRTLDPQVTSLLRDIRIIDGLFEPLMRHRVPDMTLEPGTARGYERSDDGRVYTFFIREDARWNNGDPVVAEDFITAWRRALLPEMSAYYSSLFFAIEGAESFFNLRSGELEEYSRLPSDQRTAEAARAMFDRHMEYFAENVGLNAIDERTLEIRLVEPLAYFLELTAFATFGPNHTGYIQTNMTEPSAETGTISMRSGWLRGGRLISNGPYQLDRHRSDRDVVITPNPHYWGRDMVANEGFRFLIVADESAAFRMYESGRADWWPDVPTLSPLAGDLHQQMKSGTRTDVHAYDNFGTFFLMFNSQDEYDGEANPLGDRELRRALSMAIDREGIVNEIARKGEQVVFALVPPGAVPDYDPPQEAGITFDPEEARRIIEQIGPPARRLTLLYRADSGARPLVERLIRDWRTHLNIDVEMEGTTNAIFFDRVKRVDHSIALGNWFGDYQDPTTWLHMWRTGDSNNMAGFSNEEYDSILREAGGIVDPARRLARLREAEELLLQEQPIAPMFQWVSIELYDPNRLTDINENPWLKRRLDLIRRVEP